MKLSKVTITGADYNTEITDLVDLSKDYPFVEWGILVSKGRENSYRYPPLNWIERLSEMQDRLKERDRQPLKLAVHICGQWARDFAEKNDGISFFKDRPTIANTFGRYQINYHDSLDMINIQRMIINCSNRGPIILPVNNFDIVKEKALAKVHNAVHFLYDISLGTGVEPSDWPAPEAENCGYAGGIGPDNVEYILKLINKSCPSDYVTWIDMETKVRTTDDSELDLEKVEQVLKVCKSYVE